MTAAPMPIEFEIARVALERILKECGRARGEQGYQDAVTFATWAARDARVRNGGESDIVVLPMALRQTKAEG